MSKQETQLAEQISEFFSDPYGFVLYAFPWGQAGTDLESHDGPDEWQKEILQAVSDKILTVSSALQFAVSSGHGIGKSALVTWIILWAMSTRPNLNGVVTAATKTQLETKTWRELSIWHKRLINQHWFKWTATKFYHVSHPESWFCACIPWREENPEAFAGQHEQPYNVLVIYDEGSGIADVIWEVSEGAMTTEGAMWFAFGNPTKNTGRFKECFPPDGRFNHRWNTMKIDSRTCKMTNKDQLNQWVEDYGEDSDFVKVRVRGEFPSLGDSQFIPTDIVSSARRRELDTDVGAEFVMGVDVARFGDDESIIAMRHGRKLDPLIQKYRGLSTVDLATRVCKMIDRYSPDATLIDGVGIGGGVIDVCRSQGYTVIDVQSGSLPDNKDLYLNKRAELWGNMRDWLKTASIPDDDQLCNQLTSIEFQYNVKGQMVLEAKRDMKRRGLESPDVADCLSLTFGRPIRRRDQKRRTVKVANADYDILNH